jgi:fumarate reductase flavoprotein subunit
VAKDCDVIIIGGGGAGIAAAIAALDAGASVLVCEAAQRIGGSAANSGGVIMAAGTEIQKARGIKDSVDAEVSPRITLRDQ